MTSVLKFRVASILVALLFSMVVAYAFLSFGACECTEQKIETEQAAISAALPFVVAKFHADALNSEDRREELRDYVIENPSCCSVKKAFSLIHWEYLWEVFISIEKNTSNGYPDETVVFVTGCGEYVEINWLHS